MAMGRLTVKPKLKKRKYKSKGHDEKGASDNAPSESERPKKMRKAQAKKAHGGDLRVAPQVILDASRANINGRKIPVWFSLVSHEETEPNGAPLPQISARYIRIKDGSIPISFIQKYVKAKLDLNDEDEIEIKCMGHAVIPSLTLNDLVEVWLQATSVSERVTATTGLSAKDFVIELRYARKLPSIS